MYEQNMTMMTDRCRLCSSSNSLISLFNGKCKKNREYVRKLIASTTGIKFEKNDFFKCICLTCVVQVYNFYIFKTRSLQNEEKLQALVKNSEKISHKYKAPILDLDDIILPDIDEFKDIIKPWIFSKQKTNNGEYGNIQQKNAETNRNQFETIEHGSQFEPICMVEKEVQCVLPVADCKYKTNKQFNKTSTVERSSQSEPINTADESIQCQLTEIKHSNSVDMQCDRLKDLPKKEYREIDIQVELIKELSHIETTETDKFMEVKDELYHPDLSQIKCLDTSLEPNCENTFSTAPSDLLTVQDKIQPVKICQQCDYAIYSEREYKLHKKRHMICNFCKKKFRSIKRTKLHVHTECNLTTKSPVINVARLETLKEFQIKYPEVVEELNKLKENDTKGGILNNSQPVDNLTNDDVFMGEGKLLSKNHNVIELKVNNIANKRGTKRKKNINIVSDQKLKKLENNE